MEENTFSDLHPNPDDRNKPDYETIGHSFRLPNVYGLPPRDSPYYREFTGADFNGVSPVECVSMYGTIALDKDIDDVEKAFFHFVTYMSVLPRKL